MKKIVLIFCFVAIVLTGLFVIIYLKSDHFSGLFIFKKSKFQANPTDRGTFLKKEDITLQSRAETHNTEYMRKFAEDIKKDLSSTTNTFGIINKTFVYANALPYSSLITDRQLRNEKTVTAFDLYYNAFNRIHELETERDRNVMTNKGLYSFYSTYEGSCFIPLTIDQSLWSRDRDYIETNKKYPEKRLLASFVFLKKNTRKYLKEI